MTDHVRPAAILTEVRRGSPPQGLWTKLVIGHKRDVIGVYSRAVIGGTGSCAHRTVIRILQGCPIPFYLSKQAIFLSLQVSLEGFSPVYSPLALEHRVQTLCPTCGLIAETSIRDS